MTLPENRDGRPTSDKVEAPSVSTGIQTASQILLSSAVLGELDALAAHVDGAFVVVVEKSLGRYRRRPYLTAKAAENAAQRAAERGEGVRVYLAELKPLYRIGGAAR